MSPSEFTYVRLQRVEIADQRRYRLSTSSFDLPRVLTEFVDITFTVDIII